ncbi:MAG: DUF192 domain-containing protein [Opitutaceae bacterium]
MKTYLRLFALIAVSLIVCGCSPKAVSEPPAAGDTYFPISIGDATAQLQLALSVPEQQQGLMERAALEKDHGMLFLFPKPKKQSFWMRNTQIKLDIGYFDVSGKLVETHTLYPYDETPVESYGDEILIAVEMNYGWFAKNKVRPGSMINLDQLDTALTKRGAALSDYPIILSK